MAHHMLGLIAHQRGDLEGAQRLIVRALTAQPDPPMPNRLGIVQQKLGDAAGAAASYRRALALKGELVMAGSIWPPCCSNRATPSRRSSCCARGCAMRRSASSCTTIWAWR